MVFSSPIFFFLFLPITLLVYAVTPRGKNVVLMFASVVFYAFGELNQLGLLLTSIVVNYFGGLWIARAIDSSRRRRLAILVSFNLAGLAWFKYAGFAAENVNALIGLVNGSVQVAVPMVVLPLGISFFTFHALSYLVDVYRQKVAAQRNFFDYTLYILFFPQLIAGPIIRYHDIAEQLRNHPARWSDRAEGARRIILGLAKKLLLANPLGAIADGVFGTQSVELSSAAAWLGALTYAGQIYFDFSAYSDMAIGLCRLFGFRIRENFDYPYVSQSIQEFWRRWHISLSNWFRDYLYIPLGGNRHGPTRTFANLLMVFFLCGLWHGASWTFIAWGLYHGFFLCIERIGLSQLLERFPRILRHSYALVVVMFGWVLFRADSFSQAIGIWRPMLIPCDGRRPGEFIDLLGWCVLGAACVGAHPYMAKHWLGGQGASQRPLTWSNALTVSAIGAAGFIGLFATTYNPFIYFRF